MNYQNIGLALIVLAAMAIVLANMRGSNATTPATARNLNEPIDESATPINSSVTHGPQYLVYNQSPWAFAPPVGNFLPSMVAPGGVAVPVETANKGCFTCL